MKAIKTPSILEVVVWYAQHVKFFHWKDFKDHNFEGSFTFGYGYANTRAFVAHCDMCHDKIDKEDF